MIFASSDESSYVDYAKFVDQHWRYNGHRFCREGIKEPDYDTKGTWFFHLFAKGECNKIFENTTQITSISENGFIKETDPDTCITDEVLASDDYEAFAHCLLAQAAANQTTTQQSIDWPRSNDPAVLGQYFQKTFHPKTAGFEATKDELLNKLRYQ